MGIDSFLVYWMCILYQKLRFGNPSLTHISTIPRPEQMRQARVMQEHNDILLRYLCCRHFDLPLEWLIPWSRCAYDEVPPAVYGPKTQRADPFHLDATYTVPANKANVVAANYDSQRAKRIQIRHNHEHQHAAGRQNKKVPSCLFKGLPVKSDMLTVQEHAAKYEGRQNCAIQQHLPQWRKFSANLRCTSSDLGPRPRFAPFYLRPKQSSSTSFSCFPFRRELASSVTRLVAVTHCFNLFATVDADDGKTLCDSPYAITPSSVAPQPGRHEPFPAMRAPRVLASLPARHACDEGQDNVRQVVAIAVSVRRHLEHSHYDQNDKCSSASQLHPPPFSRLVEICSHSFSPIYSNLLIAVPSRPPVAANAYVVMPCHIVTSTASPLTPRRCT